MVIYIREQYKHETRYENYQMDMLHGVLSALAGKSAKIPRYNELQERNGMFTQKQKELNGAEILNELINAW